MRALRRVDISDETRLALSAARLRNEAESHNPVMRQLARTDLSDATREWLAKNTHLGRGSGRTQHVNTEEARRQYESEEGGWGEAVPHSDSTARVLDEGTWTLWVQEPSSGGKFKVLSPAFPSAFPAGLPTHGPAQVGADPKTTLRELRWKIKMVCERGRFTSASGDGCVASGGLWDSPIFCSAGVIATDEQTQVRLMISLPASGTVPELLASLRHVMFLFAR